MPSRSWLRSEFLKTPLLEWNDQWRLIKFSSVPTISQFCFSPSVFFREETWPVSGMVRCRSQPRNHTNEGWECMAFCFLTLMVQSVDRGVTLATFLGPPSGMSPICTVHQHFLCCLPPFCLIFPTLQYFLKLSPQN